MCQMLRHAMMAGLIAGAGLFGQQASAAVVYDQTLTFDQTIADNAPVRFSASFDFSALDLASIDDVQLTLTYNGVAGAACLGQLCLGSEAWFLRAQGANSSASSDDYFARLSSGNATTTFTLSSATDTGAITAFAQTVASQVFTFWFAEQTLGNDSFALGTARLVVNGTEVPPVVTSDVPVPAAAPMLLAGLGGLMALRRGRKARV